MSDMPALALDISPPTGESGMGKDRIDRLVKDLAQELGCDPEEPRTGDPVEDVVYARFGCVLTLLLLRRIRDLEATVGRLNDAVTGAEWINLAKVPQEPDC